MCGMKRYRTVIIPSDIAVLLATTFSEYKREKIMVALFNTSAAHHAHGFRFLSSHPTTNMQTAAPMNRKPVMLRRTSSGNPVST